MISFIALPGDTLGYTGPVGWLMCEHPERPPDSTTHVHLVKCVGCRIGAEMAARLWPERWKLVYELQSLYWETDA